MLIAAVGLVWAVMVLPRTAQAGPNDLVMSRLGTEVGTGANTTVIGNNLAFRSLVSELGVVLAPRLLAPSDTLGFGGFQFTADLGISTITDDADYWRVLESSPDPAGAMGISHGDGTMTTLGLFARKGMWLPAPSFEVGLGAVHLQGSRIWGAQGYAKLAVQEGYHDLPLPSIALRAAVTRMMGSAEIDLSIASMDLSISKARGLWGTIQVEPYGGWNVLIMVPRSEVIDSTPAVAGDQRLHFVFRDQDSIVRHRFFAGAKIQHHVFALVLEADFALAGSSVDDRVGTDDDCADVGMTTASCDSEDQARGQQTYSISLGVDF